MPDLDTFGDFLPRLRAGNQQTAADLVRRYGGG